MHDKRKANHKCKGCGLEIYIRPSLLKKGIGLYCSRQCVNYPKPPLKECLFCKKKFRGLHSSQKFCNKSCAAQHPRGSYKKYGPLTGCKNNNERRLKLLRSLFDFTECMVEGCSYNKLYEIHRFIPGKEGGLYEIGNMFAICPNHHAECHRGLIKFEKISDCELRIK